MKAARRPGRVEQDWDAFLGGGVPRPRATRTMEPATSG